MEWNDHLKERLKLKDKHAFLSPSQYHWINYDDEKLIARYNTHLANERGTKLHALAEDHIKLGVPFGKSSSTLALYVNDALKYDMRPEQLLYVDEYANGTADTIWYGKDPEVSKKLNVLRIHDLKTGRTKASFNQLDVYAAYFFIEYDIDPLKTIILERIYQMSSVKHNEPDPKYIKDLIKLINHDREVLRKYDEEEGY